MIQTLEIQNFLRSHSGAPIEDTFQRLDSVYGITAKQHSRHPNLYLFKYSQISSPFSKKIVQECRGLILDKDDNWNVVCFPFTKFFNYGQPEAAIVDWSTVSVQEKLDGSMISTYNHKGKWWIATTGCPDGTNQVGDFNKTFEDLFWECFDNQKLNRRHLNPAFTYIWKLTSPINRVVVNYEISKITLIGVRVNATFQEITVSQFNGLFPIVAEYPITSIEECLGAANKLNPLEHEGYVCVDLNFNRVKIKSPAYIALHHLRDNCSLSKMAEAIRAGEYQEFSIALDSYPEIKAKFLEMVAKYEDICKWSVLSYTLIGWIKDQKAFALEAIKSPYSTILFQIRKTGKTPQSIMRDMTANAYLRLLGLKE